MSAHAGFHKFHDIGLRRVADASEMRIETARRRQRRKRIRLYKSRHRAQSQRRHSALAARRVLTPRRNERRLVVPANRLLESSVEANL